MRNASGTTPAETRLVTSFQTAIGALPDNSVGVQTISDAARLLGVECWPLGVTIFNHPVIIAKELTPAAVNGPLSGYKQAISGSFSYNCKPCSILITQGKVVCDSACHSWLGKPESVLYRKYDGTFGIRRAMSAQELPNGIKWAIGGVGLLASYDPAAEGFTGTYADVLRKTAHTFVGCKGRHVYLCYVSGMTGQQVNAQAKKLGLEMAVMLDGGHVAAINSESTQINVGQKQYYIVQGV